MFFNRFATTRAATLLLAAAAVLLTPAAALAAGPASSAWDLALSGRSDEAFLELEKRAADGGSDELRAALERRSEHLEKIEQTRSERLGEAREEMAEHIGAGEVVKALRSAVEIHTLSTDKREVRDDPRVRELVEDAEARARRAEASGDWLTAYELYYRLNLLYEQRGTYREPFDRLGRRLIMLRLYVPETLHEMRSAKLEDEGEDALPAYNDLADHWEEKLDGVSRSMLIRALNRAEKSHVEGTGLREMLLRGLDALETFVTTSTLKTAFPALGEDRKVESFVSRLGDIRRDLADRGKKAGYFELVGTLKSIDRANGETLGLPEEAMLHEFGNGAMEELDDFSAIVWPDEVEQLQRSTQGKFTGVGIKISLDESQAIKVITPLQGTPAQRAGVLPGDVIVAVDGEPTLGISLQQAVDRITGDEGTKVELTLEREGKPEPVTVSMRRAEIPIYSVKGWRRSGPEEMDWDWFIDKEHKIGLLRVTQFAEDTTRELRRAIREMRRRGGVNGIVLDLRYNPGGLLSEAVSVANLFVEEGVIVSQHDAEGIERESQRARRGNAELADVPVVVLINEGSASASEIVAGCLQDYDRAIIVGSRSYGKGSVQNVYTIGTTELALLKLTTQYYYLPSGRLIHRRPGAERWGVEPDVEVEMLPSQIADSLTLRQDADLFLQEGDEDFVPPEKLLNDGVDTQLETALLLLKSQVTPKKDGGRAITLRDAG